MTQMKLPASTSCESGFERVFSTDQAFSRIDQLGAVQKRVADLIVPDA
jgi:hypothetical protein